MIDFDDLNLKMSLILAILIYMSNLNFMLSLVEHEKKFISLGPWVISVLSRQGCDWTWQICAFPDSHLANSGFPHEKVILLISFEIAIKGIK